MSTHASNFNELVDLGFYIILGVSIVLLLAVTFVMIYFVIKYHRTKNPKATNIEGNNKLELIWTVIPTALVLVMFYYGWVGYQPMRDVPDGAMEVKAIGRMWSWTFEYDNGVKSDKLIVPINKAVKLNLVSEDVNHSLYIPAFRIKEDVTPGIDNYMWFEANIEGSYDILCAEYCGLQHSYMITKLDVLPESEFDSWLAEGGSANKNMSPAEIGYEVIRNNGCIACHSTDGSKSVGPTFKNAWGYTKTVITDGVEREATLDEEYLKVSLYEPKKDILKGFSPVMVEYSNQIKEKELQQIIDYLKSISDKE